MPAAHRLRGAAITSDAATTPGPLALVFPGQGSQQPGMAEAWRDHPDFVLWEQADDVLGRDVSRLGVRADDDELREPVNCQIALFVHEVVMLRAWRAASDAEVVAVAGHSLGEYVALVAAGALAFSDGLRLVDARARLTQRAAEEAPGAMVACLGFDLQTVAVACADAGVHIANDNAPGQVVVSGSADALDRLRAALVDRRGKVVDLNVGAAYHSQHMQPAAEAFGAALDGTAFVDAAVPVVANVDAQPHTAAAHWGQLLRRQLTSPVRWRESVQTLAGLGVQTVVELGASAVLSGMVKRTVPSLARRTVTAPDHL